MKHPFVVTPSSPRARAGKSTGTRAGENLIWFSTLGLLAACAELGETTEVEAPNTFVINAGSVPYTGPNTDYTIRGAYAGHGETFHAYVQEPNHYLFITMDWKPSDEGRSVFQSIYPDGAGVVGDIIRDQGSSMFGFAHFLDQGDIVEIVIDNFSSPLADSGNLIVFGSALSNPATTSGTTLAPVYTTSFSDTQSSYVFEASQAGEIWANVNASEFSTFDFAINFLFNREDFGTFSLNAGENFDLDAELRNGHPVLIPGTDFEYFIDGIDLAGLELKGGSENFRFDADGILHTTSLTKSGVHELMFTGVTADGIQVEYIFDLDINGAPVWANPESGWKITRGEDFAIELASALDDDPVTYELLDISASTLEFDPETRTLSGNYVGDASELTVRYIATDGAHTLELEITLEVVEPESRTIESPAESPPEFLIIDTQGWKYRKIEFALDADEEPLDTDSPLELLFDGRVFETGYYDASSHSYVTNVGIDAAVRFLDLEIEIKTDSSGEFLAPSNEYDDFKFDGGAPSEFVSIAVVGSHGGPFAPISSPLSVREFTGRTEAPENYALHVLDNNGIEKVYGIDDDLIFEQNDALELSVTTYWETW